MVNNYHNKFAVEVGTAAADQIGTLNPQPTGGGKKRVQLQRAGEKPTQKTAALLRDPVAFGVLAGLRVKRAAEFIVPKDAEVDPQGYVKAYEGGDTSKAWQYVRQNQPQAGPSAGSGAMNVGMLGAPDANSPEARQMAFNEQARRMSAAAGDERPGAASAQSRAAQQQSIASDFWMRAHGQPTAPTAPDPEFKPRRPGGDAYADTPAAPPAPAPESPAAAGAALANSAPLPETPRDGRATTPMGGGRLSSRDWASDAGMQARLTQSMAARDQAPQQKLDPVLGVRPDQVAALTRAKTNAEQRRLARTQPAAAAAQLANKAPQPAPAASGDPDMPLPVDKPAAPANSPAAMQATNEDWEQAPDTVDMPAADKMLASNSSDGVPFAQTATKPAAKPSAVASSNTPVSPNSSPSTGSAAASPLGPARQINRVKSLLGDAQSGDPLIRNPNLAKDITAEGLAQKGKFSPLGDVEDAVQRAWMPNTSALDPGLSADKAPAVSPITKPNMPVSPNSSPSAGPGASPTVAKPTPTPNATAVTPAPTPMQTGTQVGARAALPGPQKIPGVPQAGAMKPPAPGAKPSVPMASGASMKLGPKPA